MSVTLRPVQRPVVELLWQLYVHDLSEFRGTLPFPDGTYKLGRLPTYFDDPDRCGYLVYSGESVVGFVFVTGVRAEPRMMAEFFVVRGVRRQRVGHTAALAVLRRHPGRWEIPFQEENAGAARFWRQVATEAAAGPYTEERRPVPDKPHIPPDVWLTLDVAG